MGSSYHTEVYHITIISLSPLVVALYFIVLEITGDGRGQNFSLFFFGGRIEWYLVWINVLIKISGDVQFSKV